VAITRVIFGRTVRFDFFNYDDSFLRLPKPFISNGLTRTGSLGLLLIRWSPTWHPLTSISAHARRSVVRPARRGYHAVNVVLHTLASCFFFMAFRAMTGALWRSAFVASLFAIHPFAPRSVVWISERKDVLSGVFFFLALWAYSRYAKKPPAFGDTCSPSSPSRSVFFPRRCW
jgi:hypothetical protein